MKKNILIVSLFLSISGFSSSANDIDPFPMIQMTPINFIVDNPKGKLKIKFVFNDPKNPSDTTKPKTFFGKLKNVLNSLMDASDNPPFKVQIVREKKS